MINRVTKVIVVAAVMLAILPGCIMAKSDLIARLDDIETDITKLKSEYNSIIDTYSNVINSLTAESKETINKLSSNILSDDIASKVDAVKAELEVSMQEDASEVLNAMNDLEKEAKELIEENKDALDELKNEYNNLTVKEAKEVINKVKDIMTSVGISADTAGTYDKMMDILENAHKIDKNINTKVEKVLEDNVDVFEKALTVELVENLVSAVENKEMEKVADILLESLNDISGAETLKQELQNIKKEISNLESKLSELDSLDERDIVMLNDTQIKGISDKLKLIEKDYINFVKLVINDYSEVYLKVIFDKSKNVTVSKMIEYANRGLDIIVSREEIINDSKNGKDVENKLPEELMSKAGMLVALGIVDYSNYNKDYINNNFGKEIEKVASFVIEEMLDYIDHIDSMMKAEIKEVINKDKNADTQQIKIKEINSNRFKDLDNLKKLKSRLESELLNNKQSIKDKLNKYAPRVYDIFNVNILDTIEKVMSIENTKAERVYEYNDVYSYIVMDTFIKGNDFAKIIGIEEDNNAAEFNKLVNENIKTGSILTINLSDDVYQTYNYAVLGDVYADGMIDARDYMAIKNHVMEYSTLGEINQIAANAFRDSMIDSRDYMKIKNEIMDDLNKEITLGGN